MSSSRRALFLAFLGIGLAALPSEAAPWYQLGTRAELGNVPRLAFDGGLLSALDLAQTQLTARLPTVSLRMGEQLSENVDVVLSGSIRQDLEQALSNPELYQAYQSRIAWSKGGGQGLNPLYVPQIEDAILTLRDPSRNGQIRVGQFVVPFGHDDYLSSSPPLVQAPLETPMSEFLSAQGTGVYQSSAFASWRDIGVMLSGTAGAFPYAVGLINGAGPNRLDDNGAKDWFARLDWQSSVTDLIGVSWLMGNELVYPQGFGAAGVASDRRRYGVHWRFAFGPSMLLGEWDRDQRFTVDPQPRDGYVLEAKQPMGANDRIYLGYGQIFDPQALPGRGYMFRETYLGTLHTLAPGIFWRVEARYRWETSLDQHDEYWRYLTAVEASFGGPPQAPSAP